MDGLKRCCLCKHDLPHSAYAMDRRARDGLTLDCRDCRNSVKRARRAQQTPEERARNAERMRDWRRRNPEKMTAQRDALAAYKAEHGCARCGLRDSRKLAFHHVDPATKTFCVSLASSATKMWAEVTKCEVLCWTCHSKLHDFFPGYYAAIRDSKAG